MAKEVSVERVELFRVQPWGKRRGTLQTIHALKKGKTFYVPIRMVTGYARKGIDEDPKAAIRLAIKELEAEISGDDWAKRTKKELKDLKTLLKNQ